MGSYIKSLNKILVVTFIFALMAIASSCSQNTPELRNTSYSVIFDYADSENLPDARLSVFVESDSDVRRYERMVVKSRESGFIWDFDDIKNIEIDRIQYTGATNLKVPENEVIPSGAYIVTCINADEKEAELQLTVNYEDSFYELKEAEVEEKMKELNGFRKIAIYDKENVMIYFGTRTVEFQTNRDIWNYYRNAAYYQDVWCIPGNSVMCILPAHEVVPEK